MIRRGIEPDVLMYTLLISTMGRAGLEWQAYKLFSRMIEQNIQPLPETYVALRDATSRKRVALREQIQTKIEEAVDVFPEELAKAEREQQREEDRRCIAKFNEYLRGVLPATTSSAPMPAPSSTATRAAPTADATASGDCADAHPSASEADASTSGDTIATMHIRNPTDAWNTTQMAQGVRSHAQSMAKGHTAVELRASLERMDEEELRIYLAAQRQLRHGTKAQLIDRILKTVSAGSIRVMLDRRSHYFRSVEQILAADLRQLNMSGPADATLVSTTDGGARADAERDRTLENAEKESMSPEVLYAPWGILRKPQRRRSELSPPRNAERLERVRLSEPELLLVRNKAETNDLDELPESLLRRYAYQFQLRWRRKEGAASLLQAVQWHVTTYVASVLHRGGGGAGSDESLASPVPTPPIRLQKEAEGMRETLDNYEAFRVIAQRTNNLQVVDSKEINRHLQHVRQDAVRREHKMENALRRERHVMEAAGLAASAKSFTPPPPGDDGEMQVLGVMAGTPLSGAGQGAVLEPTSSLSSALVEPQSRGGTGEASGEGEDEATASELPPWALFEEEDEFNLSTGHFGDPEVGRFQELSDSRMQVLPSRTAQAQWSIDRQLLPTSLKNIVQEAELEQHQRHEAIEKEYERRLQYAKYRKWDSMITKAQERRRQAQGDSEEEEGASAVAPLPAKRRLAQLLRKGRDRQKVSAAVQVKYSRSL
ncbi:putative PPR repeat [Leishmania naiffi]|uniref:PPR repeat n=1 Tax=Leishmania naiffi TaxID=5678 RepID=A0AAW3BS30_9TRYP